MKKEQLKINVFSNNKKRIREIMKELKEEKKEEQQDS
jgi:phosphopantothenate synthetase